jgi:hypothetical protein
MNAIAPPQLVEAAAITVLILGLLASIISRP